VEYSGASVEKMAKEKEMMSLGQITRKLHFKF